MISDRARSTLNNIFSGILVLCALTVTGLLLCKEFGNRPPVQTSRVENWKELLGHGHWLGPKEARILYACP